MHCDMTLWLDSVKLLQCKRSIVFCVLLGVHVVVKDVTVSTVAHNCFYGEFYDMIYIC